MDEVLIQKSTPRALEKIVARRVLRTLATAVAVVGLVVLLKYRQTQLKSVGFASGYVLLGSVLFLACYNLRKKVDFLPLGRSATWLQFHLYVGWFAIACFGMHVNWAFPNGVLESVLFWVFVATAGSGVYGLYLSKAVPSRLARLREEVIYERIPALRRQVQETAHQLITQLLQTGDAPALVDFYMQSLVPYFATTRGVAYYFRPTSRLRNRLKGQLSVLDRYLTEGQRETQQQLARLIDRRDDLDFHDAQQGKLKYWLFLHIAATYALILVSLTHTILVHAFHGGRL